MKQANQAVQLIFKNNLTIATAESCTGGMVAAELVGYGGISTHFNEGYVTYSNEAKMKNLGVRQETLESLGAVSAKPAAEMAKGVRERAASDIGVSTTGIAGPDGGTEEKPVGLVYIGCAYQDKVIVRKFLFDGNRYQVRLAATKEAFQLLFDTITGMKSNKEGG